MDARRQGFTLVELLMVIVIGAVVLGAVYQTLNSQERVNRQQIAVISTEQNTRMALDLLSNDLREVSAADGDIYTADSLSIRYRQMRKAGVICTKDFGNNRWAYVAYFGTAFARNDSILVFQDGANKAASGDDSWGAYLVSDTNTGACAGNPFGNIQKITVPVNGMLANADTGGLVRSFVPVGYRIVNATINGQQAARLYRMEGTDSIALIDDLARIGKGGLRFRYYNAAGTVINPTTAALRASIMRIVIKVTGTPDTGTATSVDVKVKVTEGAKK